VTIGVLSPRIGAAVIATLLRAAGRFAAFVVGLLGSASFRACSRVIVSPALNPNAAVSANVVTIRLMSSSLTERE